MRLAFVTSFSKYHIPEINLPEAHQSSIELSRILASGMYGSFDCSSASDCSSADYLTRVSAFMSAASSEDDVLLYVIGHGVRLSNGNFAIAAHDYTGPIVENIDWKANGYIDGEHIIEVIMSSNARTVTLVLDCCFAADLIDQIKDRPSILNAAPMICILTAADNNRKTYTNGHTTKLTDSIIKLLQSGRAGGASRHVSIGDLHRALGRKLASQSLTPKLMLWGKNSGQLPIFSRNPNADEQIPRTYLDKLYSHNPEDVSKALDDIWSLTLNGSPSLLRRIIEQLKDFAEFIRVHQPANFDKAATLKDEVRIRLSNYKLDIPDEIIIYTPKSYYALSWFDREIKPESTNRKYFLVTDLDDLKTGTFDLLNMMEMGVATSIFVDEDTFSVADEEMRDVLIVLDRIQARDAQSQNINAYFCHGSFSQFQKTSLFVAFDKIRNVRDLSELHSEEITRIKVQFQPTLFSSLVSYNEGKLNDATQRERTYPKQHNTSNWMREPNFLIFKRGRKFVLVISDSHSSVIDSRLQRTSESVVPARQATAEELGELGFNNKNIHPIFQDRWDRFSHVIIDASIFFQYVMFPHSEVKIPDYDKCISDKGFFTTSVSSFVRSIQQNFGEKKVIFADVCRKTNKRLLEQELLTSQPVFTRFAPTPSSSLHLGNVRTAVISYLFTLTTSKRGHFHLRLDDTDIEAKKSYKTGEEIRRDLAYFGVLFDDVFAQSDPKRQKLYRAALNILQEAGFTDRTKDGAIGLRHRKLKSRISYWYDPVSGPTILHGVRVRTHGGDLDYSLNWPETEKFKYKFAGIIDDLLLSSVVVRDVRQKDSFFTGKQSIIANCLREAVNYCRRTHKVELVQEFEKEVAFWRPNRTSALPFFCPPTYVHVSKVSDERKKVLKKRRGRKKYRISEIRRNGIYFRETLLTWCLCTLGGRFLDSIGYKSEGELIQDIVSFGNEGFLLSLAGKVEFWNLIDCQKSGDIKITNLSRIDYRLMMNSTTGTIAGMLSELQQAAKIPKIEILTFSSLVWPLRGEFSGAHEIATFFRTCINNNIVQHVSGRQSVEKKMVINALESTPADVEEMRRQRKILFGKCTGPDLCKIKKIILDQLEIRIPYSSWS